VGVQGQGAGFNASDRLDSFNHIPNADVFRRACQDKSPIWTSLSLEEPTLDQLSQNFRQISGWDFCCFGNRGIGLGYARVIGKICHGAEGILNRLGKHEMAPI
jgi:hypothetical protein